MARLLALPEPPTAVFAYSDELAFAAIAHARAQGLAVPGDLSVVGTDGHPLGELLGLTTVDQDVAGQGRLAAELAVRLLRGAEEVGDVDIAVRLVDRGSTGPADRGA
jgi:DNA-binding LacI/PurR family transcriptional regulator